MTPYYQDDFVTIYHGDSREHRLEGLVVSDPPYNIGFRYNRYRDRLPASDYAELLRSTLRLPSVVIHYPERMFEVAMALGQAPELVVAWVYNSNTGSRQYRSVAWFGGQPDLSLVSQPYKNPTDRRVAALIADGSDGRALYDWWHIDIVKNVSEQKTEHPCQVPEELIARIIRTTPGYDCIIDPFLGSGTTLRVAKDLGIKAVGFDIDETYCEIAAKRCSQEVLGLVG